jgi:hypothetical protein
MRRTCDFAGRHAPFGHRVRSGYGLCIGFIDGLPGAQALFEFIRQLDWADRCAVAATGTFRFINVTGLLAHRNLEIPFGSGDFFYRSTRKQADIEMPADLDQFGGDNSHGTVIGREGFIQLRHGTADAELFVQQIYIIPGIRQIQGGLHPGNTPAHDQDRSCWLIHHIQFSA